MNTLDLRGEPCPIPVIKAKKELESVGAVVVLVDNFVAVQNLQKMADGRGYLFEYTEESDDCFHVTIQTSGAESDESAERSEISPSGVTVLITGDSLGRGSEELGRALMKGFIFSLSQLPDAPRSVIFMNAGVQLVADSAPTAADLKHLASRGTGIFACGTCLNYYDLTDRVAVGEIVDMYFITNTLAGADRLISL